MASSDSGTLCTSCGLCCDGTLFSWFGLEHDEDATALEGAGIVIGPSVEELRRARQPCAALRCEGCSVYADRPRVCRKYRCKLLKRVEAGEEDMARAGEIVANAKRLRADALVEFAKVEPLPEGLSIPECGRLYGLGALDTPQERKEKGALLVACTLLNFYLGKHFKKNVDPIDKFDTGDAPMADAPG